MAVLKVGVSAERRQERDRPAGRRVEALSEGGREGGNEGGAGLASFPPNG